MRKVTPASGTHTFVMRKLAAAVLVILLGSCTVMAQTTMGNISGVVRDPTGAVVPNANVTLRNEKTGVTTGAKSNSSGVYVFASVLPGTYQLTVAAPGFKTYVLGDQVVNVNQSVKDNVRLTVGSTSSSVQVQAKAPLVQTSSADVGGVITTKQIEMLPLNGRTNIFGLLALAPGVQGSGPNARIAGNTWANSTFETTDGVVSMEMENSRLSSVAPSLSSIGEFKVVDSTGSAASGEGTQEVIIATKEGTNHFHGSVFEYNRVRALEAANFYATSIPKAQYIRNEFGGDLGGPIKRNKAFFFGSFEGYKFRDAGTALADMPTQALLNGNFSGLPPVIDPQTGKPFPGNQIPSSMISPVAKNFFPYFAAPNIPSSSPAGLGVNYRANVAGLTNNYRYQGRVDYNFNQANTMFVRYYYVDGSPNISPGALPTWGGTSFPAWNQNLAINYTRTFSPSLVNSATFGWSRLTDFYETAHPNIDPHSFLPQLPPLTSGSIGGIPDVGITNFTGFGSLGGSWDHEPSYEIRDVLTWVNGKHTIQGGFSWLRWQFEDYGVSPAAFSFTGQYSGNAFADFLLGDLAASSHEIGPAGSMPTNDRFGAFIQDSWKATPNLTLNYGLRYDGDTQFENLGAHNMASYYPNLNELVIIKGKNNGLYPNLPIVSGSSVGINTSNYMGNDLDRFQPRFGFAYSALRNDRLVVRGGYGIYYNFMPWEYGSYYSSDQPPWTGRISYEPQAGPTPSLTFANPFPTGAGSVPAVPHVYALPRNFQYPMAQEWNFGLQSQLTRDMSVRATYLGNETEHLGQFFDLNTPAIAPGPVQPRRPYQPWGSITLIENGQTSNMQELQLAVTRRFTSGLEFQIQYALEKMLDGSIYSQGTPTDNRNIRLDRGNDPFTRRNHIVANYIYDLPFGHGERFLSTLSGPLNAILGGWATSGIVTIESGAPYSIGFSSSLEGWPSNYANHVSGVSSQVANPSINGYFNPAAFAVPQPYTYGNVAPDSLFGPSYTDWDMSLFKDFHLTERFRLQFRSDFFNTLNHPSFGNPDANISSPDVGKIFGTSSAPRAIQFAARLSF